MRYELPSALADGSGMLNKKALAELQFNGIIIALAEAKRMVDIFRDIRLKP